MSVDETRTSHVEENDEPTGTRPPGSEIESTNSLAPETSIEQVTSTATQIDQVDEPPVGNSNESIQVLSQRVEQLAGLLDEANVLSRERERIIDRLHLENQQLRAGETAQAIAPIFRDLIRLYDDLKLTGTRYKDCADAKIEEVSADFKSFCEAVEDVLYRHGVERYEVPEGSPFNSKEQKALGVVATPTEHFDRTIACIVRAGFRTDTKIIRILEVEVFRFTSSAATVVAPEVKSEPAANAAKAMEEKGQ